MRLLLLRHGEAGFNAPTDEQRSLTESGRFRLRQMLHQHQGAFEGIERIFHSPYLRTCQTTELVCEAKAAETSPLKLLTPESSAQQVIYWLSEQADESLLLVTHQPLIGNLVSLLCEGDLSRPEPMMPGCLAIIEMEFPAAGLGELREKVI